MLKEAITIYELIQKLTKVLILILMEHAQRDEEIGVIKGDTLS